MFSVLDNDIEDIKLGTRFIEDPYGVYAELRSTGPVRKVELPTGVRVWLVTDYAEARAALADPTLSKNVRKSAEIIDRHLAPGAQRVDFSTSLSSHMLNTDPPNHTRLRKLVNKAFTAGGVDHLRPRIEAITEELLAGMEGADEIDLLEAFAFPLPITVICEMLGVPIDDREDFRSWSNLLLSNDRSDKLHNAAASMQTYLIGLIEAKRAEPSADLLSALIEASEDGDRLSGEELVSMAFLLLVAGHETTVNLIGNAMLGLLTRPDQLAALKADPTLLSGAIEEFLRYDGPVNLATFRLTTQPLVLGGTEIPADEFVVVAVTAANRDEARFPDADQLDVTRNAGGHLAFGHGIHYCVGAPLARMEAEIALGGLLSRFPNMTLAQDKDDLRWRNSMIRGLEELRVRPQG